MASADCGKEVVTVVRDDFFHDPFFKVAASSLLLLKFLHAFCDPFYIQRTGGEILRRLQDLGTKLYKDNRQVEFPEFKIIQISKASREESQGTDSGHVFMSSTYRTM